MQELINNIEVYGSVERLAPADGSPDEMIDDNTVKIEVYTADESTLVSTRLLVRRDEDVYEMQ